MGGKHLREIVDQLIKYGKDKSTPVAIIRKAGTSEQQLWIGNLSTIVEQVKTVPLSPAVIVIGEVVSYARLSEKM